jgi:uncharacterized phage protein (TIGR01671 family)
VREILFRGKTFDNEWVEGFYVNQFGAHEIYCLDDSDYKTRHVDPSTVGQYTGLTDKNGNKIFEGDIVKYTSDSERIMHEVVFETRNGCAYYGIVISEVETWGFGNEVPSSLFEVIGNIHDDPELLEVSK